MNEDALMKQIASSLKKGGYDKWVLQDFINVKDNKAIRNLLERAYMETAQRDYKNRHGVVHGLATAYNSIQLFELVKNDVVKSDYMEILQLSKDEVLFTLMTAGFVHDAGRFYDDAIETNHEEHANDAISILQLLAQPPTSFILSQTLPIKGQETLKRVKELILCHDKKKEISGKVEMAIIKLADALDTGPHRVYDTNDKPELGEGEEARYQIIFNKDKCPGRYFGPLSIEQIAYDWNKTERLLNITFQIKDLACAEEIKKALNILQCCYKNSHKNVKDFADRVQMYIKEGSQQYRLHPTAKEFARIKAETTQIKDAKVLYLAYFMDITNMNGDTSIEMPLTIKNLSNNEGILFQPTILGGLEPSNWDDIGLRYWEIRGKTKKELPKPEHVRLDNNGISHVFHVKFGRKLGINKVITIKGVCLWKRFFKVLDDKMVHTVSTPTDRLEMAILFPKEVSGKKIQAFTKIKHKITGMEIGNTLTEPEKTGDRMLLKLSMSQVATDHSYGLHWKIEE